MQRIISIICIIAFSFIFSTAYSRAGGAAGDDDESVPTERNYSKDSNDESYSTSTNEEDNEQRSKSPLEEKIEMFFYAVIALIGTPVIIYQLFKKEKKQKTNVKNKPIKPSGKRQEFKQGIIESNYVAEPIIGLNSEQFLSKVKKAFFQIQDAWQNQDLKKIRKWLSDAMYQRLHLQIEMMKELKQLNKLSDIQIKSARIVNQYQEGGFSVITVMISFSMNDEFVCEIAPELNETHLGDTASEYWTFIKKTDAIEKNLYDSDDCPNCGVVLNTDGGEISKCNSCGTITYLGDYDWVLCDITQNKEYSQDQRGILLSDPKWNQIKEEGAFCMQLMEDKAANVFVHYLFSKAKNKTEGLQRFAGREVIDAISNEKPFLYNRFYIMRVTCLDAKSDHISHHMKFKISYGAQRVRINQKVIEKIEHNLAKKEITIILSKNKGLNKSKAKHWGYECAACGYPFEDTIHDKCTHCQTVVNSGEYDWIATGIFE